MSTITLPLSDEMMTELRRLTAERGTSPEEYLRRALESLIDRRRQDFTRAAEHVLEKNAELYRRLAR